jgi:hypothetical protein
MRSRSTTTIVTAALALVLSSAAFAQAPSTITCPVSGEWDVLSVAKMQPSLLSAHEHLEGTTYTVNEPNQNAYMYTDWVVTNQSENKGEVYYIKDYQGLPPNNNSAPLYGYPWDINLYDDSFIYLSITENVWTDPWSYKIFNNGSGESNATYNLRLAGRCVVPGGENSTIWTTPGSGTGSTLPYTSEYYFQPNPSDITNTSSDCTGAKEWESLGWVQTQVGTTQSGFTLTDTVNGTSIPLTILPVTYIYSCNTQNVNDCANREEFDYGIDSSKNAYGWVQWKHWTSDYNGDWGSPVQTTTLNELVADDLSSGENGTPYFPCQQ